MKKLLIIICLSFSLFSKVIAQDTITLLESSNTEVLLNIINQKSDYVLQFYITGEVNLPDYYIFNFADMNSLIFENEIRGQTKMRGKYYSISGMHIKKNEIRKIKKHKMKSITMIYDPCDYLKKDKDYILYKFFVIDMNASLPFK